MMRFLFSLLTLFITTGQAQISAEEIIDRVDKNERIASSTAEMEQIIITSGGSERTLSMKVYTRDYNEKQLSVYTAPSRVKGDKILMLDDGNEIWFYTPKTDRVRHLASHARKQKVQGSDFSYQDMAGGSIKEKFTASLIGEEEAGGKNCYKMELLPTDKGPDYQKLLLWVDIKTFASLQIDYYEDNVLSKRLHMKDIEKIDGHWYAMTMEMENILEGGKTIIRTQKIELNSENPDEWFSTNYLKRN